MTQPKAKWEDDGLYWYASIGVYGLSVCPKYGDWTAHSDEPGYDAPGWFASGNVGTPCDVVTLMLAAESALATHLRAVAYTMTWPEVEADGCLTYDRLVDGAEKMYGTREAESPGKISLTVTTTTDGAKVAAQAAAIGDAFAKSLALLPPTEAPHVRSPFIIGTCRLAPPPPEYQELITIDLSVSTPPPSEEALRVPNAFSAELSRKIDDLTEKAMFDAVVFGSSVRVEGERATKHPFDEARFFADFGKRLNSDEAFKAYDMFRAGSNYDSVRALLVPTGIRPAPSSPPPMYKIENGGPTTIYVDGVRCDPGESLAPPPPIQACPNCMTMTAEHRLGCPRKPTSCECCAAEQQAAANRHA